NTAAIFTIIFTLYDSSNCHCRWANASSTTVVTSQTSTSAVVVAPSPAEEISNEDIGELWSTTLLERASKNQDPYVAASPLSVAALFCDLPLSSRGPVRIEQIHENQQQSSHLPPPMSLLTAGWRTDGLALADAARELMMDEVRLFCLPYLAVTVEEERVDDDNEKENDGQQTTTTRLLVEEGSQSESIAKNDLLVVTRENEQTNNPAVLFQQQQQQPSYYGRRIAEGLSYYLARCTFSEGMRSLSCVGLLACGDIRSNSGQRTRATTPERGGGGSLYLIDATGTHRVRAHAIGNGSSVLHRRMVFVDFDKMDCREGLRVLLRLISEESRMLPAATAAASSSRGGDDLLVGNGDKKKQLGHENTAQSSSSSNSIMAKPAFVSKGSNRQKKEEGQSTGRKSWSLPSNTAVELAVLKSGEGRMRRVRLSSLFLDN
ncbi:hypothetical protein ACHAXR_005014, partial [Thalassiosira sp. AJA248-18]